MCPICSDTGMKEEFQAEYGVGNYWSFCKCDEGKKEEEQQYAAYYAEENQ